MASRQEQKEQRRQERLAAEQADAAARARAKRVQMALAGLLAAGVVVGVVLLATSGGSGGVGGKGGGPLAAGDQAKAKLPPARVKDLAAAAKAAGCELKSPPIEGSTHVPGKVKYRTNPPTSGNHSPEPALDGIYAPANAPEPENYVHALEHGRVIFEYRRGTPTTRIAQLETLGNEPINGKDAYKILVLQNSTGMPYAVAATAWGQLLGCKTFDDASFDALRDFRTKYVDKGPEPGIPPTN